MNNTGNREGIFVNIKMAKQSFGYVGIIGKKTLDHIFNPVLFGGVFFVFMAVRRIDGGDWQFP